MSQTQLGSMFIGSPSTSESLRRESSTPGAIIHIVDKHSNRILDDILPENILENEHYRSLLDSLETFEFTTFADKRFSPYLEKRNRVIIPDDDRGFMEFIISESIKIHEEGGFVETEVYADASYLELKKSRVIEPQTLSEYDVTMHANFALNGTAWRVGDVESANYRTITIDNHTNPYNYLKTVANEFDLELNFRVEVQHNRVVGRYVDLVEQIGEWRGTEVEFGRNLGSIKRVENTDELVTALVGLGPRPAEEGDVRAEVFVEDNEALQRWGFVDRDGNRQHLIEYYEPQSDRQDMTEEELRQYTQTELDKRVNESIQYESEIHDLEHVPGLHNYKLRFGDTLRIKDTLFNPPLYLEARIHSQRRNIKERGRKKVVLGDYTEFTEEEVTAIWQQLRDEIRAKIGVYELLEYAEPKRYESITEPENKERIWVDTSQPQRVIKVYEDEEWRAVGDVTGENTANDVVHVGGSDAETVRDNASAGKEAKDTVDENKPAWDRSSAFNEDGTLDVEKLYGLIPDDALVSAADWNRQGTYIDETGVYTGTIITDQLVAGDVLIDEALIREISADTLDVETQLRIGRGEDAYNNQNSAVTTIDESGISVQDGSFYLIDSETGTQNHAVFKENLLRDHSFESLGTGSNIEEVLFEVEDNVPNPWSGWMINSGTPRVIDMYYHQGEMDSEAIFGFKSMVSNWTNYMMQRVPAKPNTQYSLSFYAKRVRGYSAGFPRLSLIFLDISRNELGDDKYNFPDRVNSSAQRFSRTVTTPPGTSFIEVRILCSSSNDWVMIDGAEMVEAEVPGLYNPENSVSQLINGQTRARHIYTSRLTASGEFRALGDVDLSLSGTSRRMNLDVAKSMALSVRNSQNTVTLYTPRTSNDMFQVRSHSGLWGSYRNDFRLNSSGEIVSPPTIDNPVTWSGRAAVGASSGRFGFVSSSERYKLLIEDVKEDPYGILNVNPRSWIDKLNAEKYADIITKMYNGEEVEELDVEPVERIGGLIAEEVHEAGLHLYVNYDKDGNPDGVDYDRIWTLLIPIVRDLKNDIDDLKSKISELER